MVITQKVPQTKGEKINYSTNGLEENVNTAKKKKLSNNKLEPHFIQVALK